MEKVIKKVLNLIEKNGFEAYIVGGFVRDLLLGKNSWDIDICTNAVPKDLIKIFPNANVGIYGAVDFKVGKYSFEITTYRKEFSYQDRHPSKVEYINNLFEDLKRRDFTINTICLNQQGHIIDPFNAREDINKKLIKMVGDPKDKLTEDSLRILRAIRFATCLNFDIDVDLTSAIKKNVSLVSSLSDYRIIEEMTKILIHDNYQRGLQLLSDFGVIEQLGISYSKVVKTDDVSGMWAQFDFQKKLAFNKETLHNIDVIKKIISDGQIDREELFEHGLYFCLIAGQIIGISKKEITTIYKKMPIRSIKDIAVSAQGIIKYLNINPNEKIREILDDLKIMVLNGEIQNKPKAIYKYLNTKYNGGNYEN